MFMLVSFMFVSVRAIGAAAALVVTLRLPALAQTPTPELAAGDRCERARVAKALGLDSPHHAVGCLTRPGERWLGSAVRQPDGPSARETATLPVWLGIVRGDRALWRDQVTVGEGAPAEVREAIAKAEDRFVW